MATETHTIPTAHADALTAFWSERNALPGQHTPGSPECRCNECPQAGTVATCEDQPACHTH